ncbi:MAG: RNA-binding protein [Candidatus Lokiarchaeota archaeon]|nr:RNA-binding protein [Candidatus Lokiarchaeota archaeon]
MTENNHEIREIVIPGEILTEDKSFIPGRGAIRQGDRIISIYIGLKEVRGKYINVVPLRGKYRPEIGDKVIGKIVDITSVKWRVDINAKDTGILKPRDAIDVYDKRSQRGRKKSSRELEAEAMKMYELGDMLIANVVSVDRVSDPVLTTVGESLGKIDEGTIIGIDVPKIPRIIGKKGSMIKLLKDLTTCRLFIAKNGLVWVKGATSEYEKLCIEAIRKIEREAHTTGLTDRINYYIQEKKKERGLK